MTDAELVWLAGLLEGEGHFCERIEVQMKDQDTIAHVAALWGRPYIQRKKTFGRDHHAHLYRSRLGGSVGRSLMRDLYPYLSTKRRADIRRRGRVEVESPPFVLETLPNSLQLCWLAGLLEAEGTFLRPSPSKPRIAVIALEMCDQEVVAAVGRHWDRKVQTRCRKTGNRSYMVRLRGRPALAEMRRVFPYMHTRRRAQILSVLHACSEDLPTPE